MAKKEALKGHIEEARERLAAVEAKITSHYDKAKELQAEAYQIELNYQEDIVKRKEAKELKELAKSHLDCAEQIKSDGRFIAARELNELLEKARFVKRDISHYTQLKEGYEVEKEQLKQKLERKINDIDHELENTAWQLEQAETLLAELEGSE